MFLTGLNKKGDITTSSELLRSMMMAGWGTSSGLSITPETALTQSTVYSCVRVLTSTIGSLPFHVFKSDGESREKVDHRLKRIFSLRPNRFQTAQQFNAMMDGHLELRGNFYAYKDYSVGPRGGLEGLIPLNPDCMVVSQKADYSLEYHYTDAGGKKRTYSSNEIFHVTGLTTNGFMGISPIHAQRDSIGLAKAQEKHGASLFKNRATPSGVLRHPSSFQNDAAIDRFKKQVSEATTGDNAHGMMVLENGMEWQQIGLSSEDTQWIESRGFQAHEICGMFGVPPQKAVLMDKATFNNVEQMQIHFVQEAITPRLVGIEQAICTQLLTEKEVEQGIYPKFNVDGLLRADVKTRGEHYWRMFQMGAMSPNDIRAKENMNPRPDGEGDNYFTPVNMTANPDELLEGSAG